MCRFVLYYGPPVTLRSLLVEPTNSLIHQSFHSYESVNPLNGDGFGIAWYVPRFGRAPALFRSMSPAWSNKNLLSLSRVTDSPCILAHVRAASPGLAVSEGNCHPFVQGRFAFMHNGMIAGFHRVRRRLIEMLSDRSFDAIQGSTDSEHLFALLLDELGFGEQDLTIDELVEALRRTIARLDALVQQVVGDVPSYLNLAISDGNRAVASRYVTHSREEAASLHFSVGSQYRCIDGACRMVASPGDDHAVLISSEPLSDDPSWKTVPANHFVAVDADRTVRLISI